MRKEGHFDEIELCGAWRSAQAKVVGRASEGRSGQFPVSQPEACEDEKNLKLYTCRDLHLSVTRVKFQLERSFMRGGVGV